MSIIVKFFAAPHDAAATTVSRHGPDGVFTTSAWGNFDPEEAVVEWESVFTGRGVEWLVEAGEPRAVAGPDDARPLVFAVSERLLAALAAADGTGVAAAVEAWCGMRAETGDALAVEVADAMLGELAGLAREAAGRGHGMYCWVA